MGEQTSLEFDFFIAFFTEIKHLKFEKITKIFTPIFKSNIFGVKINNLIESFIAHLIIQIKLGYIQI